MPGSVCGGAVRFAGGVVVSVGVFPVVGCMGCSGMVGSFAASLAAPSALRFAAAVSLRWEWSALRCVLLGSCSLVGRGRVPRPPPRRLLVPVLGGGLRLE